MNIPEPITEERMATLSKIVDNAAKELGCQKVLLLVKFEHKDFPGKLVVDGTALNMTLEEVLFTLEESYKRISGGMNLRN